jgi:hypothetical protein
LGACADVENDLERQVGILRFDLGLELVGRLRNGQRFVERLETSARLIRRVIREEAGAGAMSLLLD